MKIILTAALTALLVWAIPRLETSIRGHAPLAHCTNPPSVIMVPVPMPQKGSGA